MGGGCCIGDCCIMDNAVGDFFRDIFGGGSSGGGCGYHPGPSKTEQHAKKIANELAEMKANVHKTSEKTETKVIEYINRSMESLVKELENLNKETYGGRTLNINIKGIREKNEQLKKEVVGSIGNVMDGRLVLTDPELSVILKENNDKKRNEKFDAFCKRVQKSALSELEKKIKKTVELQQDMIEKEITNRLEEVKKSMEEAEKAYLDIVEIKKKDDDELAKKQIQYMYQYNLYDILNDELKELKE